LRESLPYLLLAEKDYSALAIPSCRANVLGFLTMVYHRLGMEEELEGAAARHGETQEELNELRREEVSQEVKKVWTLVGRIGQRIANKYMAN
jgi:anaphase-promoting complex subunit 5